MINKLFLKAFGKSKFTFNKQMLIINNSKSLLNNPIIINTKNITNINFVVEKETLEQNNIGNFNLIMNFFDNDSGETVKQKIGVYKEEKFAVLEKDKIVSSFYGKFNTIIKAVGVFFLAIVLYNFTIDIVRLGFASSMVNTSSVNPVSMGAVSQQDIARNLAQAQSYIEQNQEALKQSGINPEALKNELQSYSDKVGGAPNLNLQNQADKLVGKESKGTQESEAVLGVLGK